MTIWKGAVFLNHYPPPLSFPFHSNSMPSPLFTDTALIPTHIYVTLNSINLVPSGGMLSSVISVLFHTGSRFLFLFLLHLQKREDTHTHTHSHMNPHTWTHYNPPEKKSIENPVHGGTHVYAHFGSKAGRVSLAWSCGLAFWQIGIQWVL